MIVFGLVVIALMILGTHIVRVLWLRVDPAGAAGTSLLELITAGGVTGLAAWLAVNWLLALSHALVPAALWISVGALLVTTAVLVIRRAQAVRRIEIGSGHLGWLVFLVPLGLWLVFILWRGAVLPPASHDVLAYHLPKAVMLERAGGWELFQAPDWRITRYPFNYELLLADVLMLEGTDRYTEWIATTSWLLLLIAAAALARRWWTSGVAATVAVVLAAASAPVIILHSGAHKNDLLVAWLAVCALLWGSRWFVHGGAIPLVLTMVSLGLGLGTKTTIVATAAGLAPFLLVRGFREWKRGALRARFVARTALAAVLVLVLGGGFTYLVNLTRMPGAADLGRVTTTATELTHIAWGDWNNLWQVPYLLVTIPFSGNPEGVWAPWSGRYWFWPHYEIYFSHYGKLFSLLLLALPLVLWKFGSMLGEERRRECRVVGAAATLAILIMLPTVFRPVGMFGAMARYFLFVVPIVCALAIPPLITAAANVSRRLAQIVLATLAIVYSLESGVCAVHDRFAPLEYATWASEHPGTRFVYFYPYRAGSVVDRMAGPNDKIAVDGAFDTWVYPAYGALRTRPVLFLPSDANPDTIPPDARWVIVDRSWNALWSNPDFHDLGQMWQFIGRGKADESDTRLLRALARDQRFRLVYHDATMNQAVYQRLTR